MSAARRPDTDMSIQYHGMGPTQNTNLSLTSESGGYKVAIHLRSSLINPVPLGISRCALIYSLGQSMRTLWWFTHANIPAVTILRPLEQMSVEA